MDASRVTISDKTYDLDTKKGMAGAVEWQTMLVDQIKEGGIWFVPRGAVYTIYGDHKVAVQSPSGGDEAMGWSVRAEL